MALPSRELTRFLIRLFRNDWVAGSGRFADTAGLQSKPARQRSPVVRHKPVSRLKCVFQQGPIHADPQPAPTRELAQARRARSGIAAHRPIERKRLNSKIGMPPIDHGKIFDLFLVLVGDDDERLSARLGLTSQPIDAGGTDSAIRVIEESDGFHSKEVVLCGAQPFVGVVRSFQIQ